MSQKAIREFDAKSLRSEYSSRKYSWVLVSTQDTFDIVVSTLKSTWITNFVVKPDQLFGKRGKYWLVGVNLEAQWVQEWIQEKRHQQLSINNVEWILTTFLVEEFVPHEQEYYVAIKTDRDSDILYFSLEWWVEVEENRDKVLELRINVLQWIQTDELSLLISWIKKLEDRQMVQDFLLQFYDFFKQYWLAYLEVNPFVLDSDWNIVCLDMVARVDTCEWWKHVWEWKNITWVEWFWSKTSEFEKKVEAMDAETWASLKFVTLNPDGNIALLLWSWWASVAIMDKFSAMWMIDDLINYWELSWNPNYRHNREYVQWLFEMLYSSPSKKQKYLCYLWPIANFTRIDVIWKAFVDALTDKVDKIKEQKIKIVVRRWWVNDTKWLALIEKFCTSNDIPCFVAWGEVSITDAMEKIKL